ncbi:periodic tryptophan protein 1 homolog [Tubulanus polymorphus]|uniref:periodic tryptophan protein 1 homolog n=1 Tax=Tubulanus polymorphus TaxID=672921 RepID=UPI003DA6BF88
MSENIIPCLTWVKSGVAKSNPEKVHLTAEELKRIIEETKANLEGIEIADDDVSSMSEDELDEHKTNIGRKRKKKTASRPNGDDAEVENNTEADNEEKDELEADDDDDTNNVIEAYGFDDYDDEIDDNEAMDNFAGSAYYEDNADDPYITLKDEDSDEEDFVIKPTDNMILVPRVKTEQCLMEVYVYNDSDGALYVHHDFMLTSFPLAIEWMNYNPDGSPGGNFVAVGTMEPVIDIWDIDLVDSVEPTCVLGEKKQLKKKKKKTGVVGGHTDAVLALSWNSHARNVLASGSADETIALWDLSQRNVVKTIHKHTDKVQALKWHPLEAQTLLSGGFDKIVNLYDCRSPDDSNKSWTLQGEVENITWNPFSPYNFLASTDGGFVYLLDVRTDKTLFTLSAHTSPCTGISLSSRVPGLLVTSSTDGTMKIWDILDDKPKMIREKPLGQGQLMCCACCPDAPYVFALGGSKDLAVLDIRESADVKKHFQNRTELTPDSQTQTTSSVSEFSTLDLNSKSSTGTKSDTASSTSSSVSAASYKRPNKKKKKKPGK